MFIAALFTVAKLWKQQRCPTTDEQIKKVWYLYTTEFYSALKKNEILLFAGKWTELKNIILVKLTRFRNPKTTYSLSYVEYWPKTNISIIIYTYKYIQIMYLNVGLVEEIREEENKERIIIGSNEIHHIR
jgi:hypothetical protein